MWIIITKTYAGPAGLFAAGLKYDLPESQAVLLKDEKGKRCWRETVAPWDEQTDREALRLAQQRQGYELARARAAGLRAESGELKQKADALVNVVADRQAAYKKAESQALEAKKAAEKKGASDKAKSRAFSLARESEKAGALFQLAHSNFSALLAEGELKRLEAEDAERQAKKLAKDLAIKGPKGEPKADGQPQGPAVPPAGQSSDVPDEVSK